MCKKREVKPEAPKIILFIYLTKKIDIMQWRPRPVAKIQIPQLELHM